MVVEWLSFSGVEPNSSSNCNFGLQYVNSSGVNRDNLYNYSSGSPSSNSNSNAVRPLASINFRLHVPRSCKNKYRNKPVSFN